MQNFTFKRCKKIFIYFKVETRNPVKICVYLKLTAIENLGGNA